MHAVGWECEFESGGSALLRRLRVILAHFTSVPSHQAGSLLAFKKSVTVERDGRLCRLTLASEFSTAGITLNVSRALGH